ncbi:ATP-binding protein [Actinokineospora sp. 24-640]
MALAVRLTGEVAVERGGLPAAGRALRSTQAQAVLALLVLERARPVGRDELAALLWGDDPPSSWESVLRTAVARVRAALADAGLDGRSAVRATPGGYRTTLPADTAVDVEQAIADADAGLAALDAGLPAGAVCRLAAAEAVAGAPFLVGTEGAWVGAWRTRLRALRVRALEALCRARTATGQAAEAALAAREVIDLDPFRESAHRLLMTALAAAGNRAQALVVYEQCRALLAEELGADPSPETEAVFLGLLDTGSRPVPRPRADLPARLRAESGGLLVGRLREVAAVREAMVRDTQGPPSLALVAGEAGMGKTALVAHAARSAGDAGALVLHGRCDEEVVLAYRPVVECVAQLAAHLPAETVAEHVAVYGAGLPRLVPELRVPVPAADPGADQQTERHLLFRSVAALLASAAADRPLVLVIDDLHWADKPSLLLLRYLATAADPARLALVATYRDGDLAGDAERTVRELLGLPGARRVALAGLGDDDLVPLVESAAGQRLGGAAVAWAHAVGRESGGNPFFARELLAHLVETGWSAADPADIGLPETVREVVARRVDRLGGRVPAVLACASVLGQEFDLATLAVAAGETEDDVLDGLDRAVGAGLLVERAGDEFAFRHALVQRTTYQRMGETRRRRLHRAVARALESGPLPGARVGELARHWLLGHRPDEAGHAAGAARAAGVRALADLAPDQALRWFTEALSLVAAGDPLRVDVLIGLGEAQRGVGDQAYRETLLTAGRLAEAGGDTARLVLAAVANNRGSVSSSGRTDTERVALLESAIAAIGDDPHPQRPLLGATLAVELLADDQADRRRALADGAVDRARALGDPGVLGRVLALRFEATWAPATQVRRLADTAELLGLAGGSADRRLRFLSARLRAIACWEAGLLAESDARVAEELRIAADIGEPYLRWVAALSEAGRLQAAARLAEAEAAAEAALRLGTDAGEPDAVLAYGAQLMGLRRQQGRAGELLPALSGMVDYSDYDMRPAIALIHTEDDDLDAARAAVGDVLDRPLPEPASQLQVQHLCLLAVVASALGEGSACRRLYERLRPCSGLLQLNQVVREGPIDYQLGLVACGAGELDTAVEHLTAAVRDAAALPYWLAEAQVALADALLRRGGADSAARSLVERACATAVAHGFGGTARKAGRVRVGAGGG